MQVYLNNGESADYQHTDRFGRDVYLVGSDLLCDTNIGMHPIDFHVMEENGEPSHRAKKEFQPFDETLKSNNGELS